MSHKYKVGEKVVVSKYVSVSGVSWVASMDQHVGKTATITMKGQVYDGTPSYRLDIDNGAWLYPEGALTLVGAATTNPTPAASRPTKHKSDLDFFASVGAGMCRCGIPKHQCEYHAEGVPSEQSSRHHKS